MSWERGASNWHSMRRACSGPFGTQEAVITALHGAGVAALRAPCGQPMAGCLRFAPAQPSMPWVGSFPMALPWAGMLPGRWP